MISRASSPPDFPRFRNDDSSPGLLRHSRSKAQADSHGTGDGTSSRSASAGRLIQPPGTVRLPRTGQAVLKSSCPTPTGNHMLDRVLGRLNTPKLLGAFDRMVATHKRALRKAVQEFDLHGDGVVSKEEMARGLRKVGVLLDPSEFDTFFRALDVDQRGIVQVDGVMWIMTLYRSHFKLDQTADKTKLGAGRPMQSQGLPPVQTEAAGIKPQTERSSSRADRSSWELSNSPKYLGELRQSRFKAQADSPKQIAELLRQSWSKAQVDSHGADDGRPPCPDSEMLAGGLGEGTSSMSTSAGRLIRRLATVRLPRADRLMLKSPSRFPIGNHVLDGVLGKLNTPKLLGALDRLVDTRKGALRNSIKDFDLDGDGIISKNEMAIGLRKLRVSLDSSELDAFFRAFDVDQRGMLEVDWVIGIMSLYRQSTGPSTEASSSDPASTKAATSDRTEAAMSEKEREIRKYRESGGSLDSSELDAFSRAYDVDRKLLKAVDRMMKAFAVDNKEFMAAVTEFDLDGDGIISHHEMAAGLLRFGLILDKFELDVVMRTFDVDQNGTVELNEFIDVMTLYHSRLQLDQTADTEKVGAGRLKQSQSLPCLRGISQPVPKPLSPTPTPTSLYLRSPTSDSQS